VSIDPKTSSLAVTGGQDDKAYVWKVATGEVVFECTGMLGLFFHYLYTKLYSITKIMLNSD